MKVRKFGKILTIFLCFAFIVLAMPFSFSAQPTFAENFTSETRSDENFTMKMTSTSRQNTSLPKITKKDTQDKNTYLCFQWRDLKRLDFHITADNHSLKEGQYYFKVTHMQTETLLPVFNNQEKTIYQGEIGDFVVLDLYYNIDSVLEEDPAPKNFAGHDYGLYKFDFIYSRQVSGEFKDVSLGAIFVAVLPDRDIAERLQAENVRIMYSVSSSNELINVINLSLSGDALKYVRPDLITWVAYGTSTDNVNYCLTQEMKDLDIELANYVVVWENYQNIHGTKFVLDTKEIEGIWQAYCIVKDYDGQEFTIPVTEGLSTIKILPKNWFWLIILILGIVLVLLLVLALAIVFVMKKREKVY